MRAGREYRSRLRPNVLLHQSAGGGPHKPDAGDRTEDGCAYQDRRSAFEPVTALFRPIERLASPNVVVAQPVINLHSTLQTPSLDLVFAAVAAAGTLILALATAWLAHQTTALARSTSSDVAAQFRPALVSDVDQAPEPYGQDGTLRLRIKNSGHGPALDIKARVPTNEVTAAPWHRGSLAAGDSVLLEFFWLRQRTRGSRPRSPTAAWEGRRTPAQSSSSSMMTL